MERATHQSGQRGKFGAADANGFGQFISDTGATFTAHASEVVTDALDAPRAWTRMALWAGWPKGCLTLRSRRSKAGRKSLVVRATKGGRR